jgi:hypothetical protein
MRTERGGAFSVLKKMLKERRNETAVRASKFTMKKKDILISIAIIAAAALTLWLYLHRTGYVEVEAGGADATLELRSSLFGHVTIQSNAKPTEVRAITYRPQHLGMLIKQGGRDYQFDSYGPWGKLSQIGIENGKTTILRFGPPFRIKPAIHRSGESRIIDFSIIGRAGEEYRYSRNASAPKVKVVDEQGNALASGTFEFG